MTKKQLSAAAEGASIDLGRLSDMHRRLPIAIVSSIRSSAALGLQRNNHDALGTALQLAIESERLRSVLTWPVADLGEVDQHDSKHITEDGAEAIALAVAHTWRAWRVVRRTEQEKHADWLLEYEDAGERKLVAFEVSGTDQTNVAGRIRDKLDQTSMCNDVDRQCIGVVGFKQSQTVLRSVTSERYVR